MKNLILFLLSTLITVITANGSGLETPDTCSDPEWLACYDLRLLACVEEECTTENYIATCIAGRQPCDPNDPNIPLEVCLQEDIDFCNDYGADAADEVWCTNACESSAASGCSLDHECGGDC